MLKRIIAFTVIGIVVVFGVIAAVLFLGKSGKASAAGNYKVIYNNGFAFYGKPEKQIERKIKMYVEEGATEATTRERDTKLAPSNTFTLEGYSFAGWQLGYNGEIISDEYIPGGLSGIIVLVASWIPNTYNISFVPNIAGIKRAPDNYAVTKDAPMVGLNGLKDPEGREWTTGVSPVVGTLVFAGWRTMPNGQGDKITEGMPSPFTQHSLVYGSWGAQGTVPTDPENPNPVNPDPTKPVTDILIGGPASVVVNNSVYFPATVMPTSANAKAAWTITNKSAGITATINATTGEFRATAVGTSAGTVTISVTAGGVTKTKTVTVHPVYKLTLSYEDATKKSDYTPLQFQDNNIACTDPSNEYRITLSNFAISGYNVYFMIGSKRVNTSDFTSGVYSFTITSATSVRVVYTKA
jgi:hypothetical protein